MNHDDPRGSLPHDDAERDAWLREALRHAPDASAAAPEALRESILAQARAATASRAAMPTASSRSGSASALAAFWAWLARPPVATGFAGVMAATLVGLMWWDQPMDLARPAPASPAAERAVPAPALERSPTSPVPTVAAPPPTVVPPAPTMAGPPPAETMQAPAAGARAPGITKEADAPAGRSVRSGTTQPNAFPSTESKTTAPPPRANEGRLAKQETRAAAPPPAAQPPAAIPPATPAPAAPALAAAPASPRDRQRMAAAGEARRDAEPSAFATAPPRAAAEEAAKAGDQSVADPREVAEPAPPMARRNAVRPLATLLASLAADPSRWSRRAADGAREPLDEATRRWLGDVEAATSGRWTAAPATPSETGAAADAASRSVAGRRLVLWLDGRPAALLALGGSAISYDDVAVDGATRRWRAPLSETDAARLASTWPR